MTWDGEERRRSENDRLRAIELQLARLCSHFVSEFGGEGSEGNVNRNLRELKDSVMVLSGKTRVLELWQAGVTAVTMVIVLILSWVMPTIIKIVSKV